jgi:hypothetical protein
MCAVAAACQFWREVANSKANLWTTILTQTRSQNIRLYYGPFKGPTASCSNQAVLPAWAIEQCTVQNSLPTITSSERYRICSFDVLVSSPVNSRRSLEPLIADYLGSAHSNSTTTIGPITIYLIYRFSKPQGAYCDRIFGDEAERCPLPKFMHRGTYMRVVIIHW